MITFAFAFEQIYFMKFAFDICEFFLASSHPYPEPHCAPHFPFRNISGTICEISCAPLIYRLGGSVWSANCL